MPTTTGRAGRRRRRPQQTARRGAFPMLARLSATDRFALIQGARDYSPTLMAILSWGLVTGIAMSKSVTTLGQATAMSLLVYAGSSQLAVLP
ncbi:AzlC family ABC transporter permease, partial [Burkholderia pseudomallei]|uniref:AzlC family ABC transporter permease n=1 Tax=Burkholderia pseudomallei TaxID=28450 RepID=UPI0021F6D961